MSKAPKLRFKEFSGDWEEKKLGNYLIQYTDITTVNNQYPPLTSSRRGIFLQEEYFNKQVASKDNTGYNIVPRNYFTYRHMSDDSIFYFNINSIVDYGIVSTLYPVFTTDKSKLNSNYLKEYLNESDRFRKYSVLQKQGGSRTYMYFSKLKEFMMPIPKIEEQEKIASFFSLIDDKICLQSEKVEALKDYKRGMMQKIFSRELRFKDDEGRDYPEWEEKKLGEITNLTDGVHFTPEYVESGVPFWSVETIVSNSKPKYITEEAHKDAIRRCYPKKGDILLTRIGTLAVPKLVDWDDEFSIYVSVALIKSSDKYNSKFAKYYFESEEYQKDFLSKSLLTATPKKINMEDLKQTKIKLPVLEEQEKIGMLLSSIEQKIVNEEEKLYSLNEYKKGLLQQMFV